jgi:methionine-rich copper-binding protein CopC
MRTPFRTVVVVLLAVAWCVGFGATAAGAHSSLEESSPTLDEEVVELTTVTLRFGEPLIDDPRNLVWIIDAADQTISLGTARLVERNYVLEADLLAPLLKGKYFVRYRAVSSDGDGLQEGGFSFSVVDPPGSGGTFVLLGIGLGAMAVVVFLLRPRGQRDPDPEYAIDERGDSD